MMNKIEILKNIIEAQTLNQIFSILKENAQINAFAIYEKNDKNYDLKLSFGENIPKLSKKGFYTLKINNVEWARLVFDTTLKNNEFLELISCIISEKIKSEELQKLASKQISLLQAGIINHESEVTARTTFFAKITHDLRTPLNSILGYCGLLREEVAGKLNTVQKNYLLDIESSAVNLLSIINDILDFSKISAKKSILNITNFNISQVFFEAENIVKPLLLKKQQKLITNISDFSINADYQKTLGIIVNLLSNSIKYSPEKSKIELNSLISQNSKIIEIKDSGMGIPKKALKRIFSAFSSGKNNKGHENTTGLGLTIVQNFVKMHEWEINIDSKENLGTTVTVYVS